MAGFYMKRNTGLKWVKTLNEIYVGELLHPWQVEYLGRTRGVFRMLQVDHITSNFLKAVFHKFHLVYS